MVKRKATPKAVLEVRKWHKLKLIASEASNEANRQKTIAKNAIILHMQGEGLKPTAHLAVEGTDFHFGVTESQTITAEKWHELFKSGEITEAQYFRALSVGNEKAKLELGEDQFVTHAVKVTGKKADIRITELADDSPYAKGVHVYEPKVKAKAKAKVKPTGKAKPRIRRKLRL